MNNGAEQVYAFIDAYEDYLTRTFRELWSKVSIDPLNLEAYSVIGGLLARQVTLSIQLARSPLTWNPHSAPLFLRSQTDLHITLAWTLGDLAERAKKYIMHGLGEQKLLIEQYKMELEKDPDNPNRGQMEAMIELWSGWVNNQRNEWFVEVNLGHWAQLDTRTMAIEADCEDLYKFAYKPFSVGAHSMWPHVSVYNSRSCTNPLHRNHLIPELPDFDPNYDFVYRSCKYVHCGYEAISKAFGISLAGVMPLEWFAEYFSKNSDPGDHGNTVDNH